MSTPVALRASCTTPALAAALSIQRISRAACCVSGVTAWIFANKRCANGNSTFFIAHINNIGQHLSIISGAPSWQQTAAAA